MKEVDNREKQAYKCACGRVMNGELEKFLHMRVCRCRVIRITSVDYQSIKENT